MEEYYEIRCSVSCYGGCMIAVNDSASDQFAGARKNSEKFVIPFGAYLDCCLTKDLHYKRGYLHSVISQLKQLSTLHEIQRIRHKK
jgi:hypothetical protein